VGEPIMYPHINDLVSELHRRRISSFLVTNAQVGAAHSLALPRRKSGGTRRGREGGREGGRGREGYDPYHPLRSFRRIA
jgi:hypothetical protein